MFQICLPGLDVAVDPSVKHSPRIPHPVLTISYWGFWLGNVLGHGPLTTLI